MLTVLGLKNMHNSLEYSFKFNKVRNGERQKSASNGYQYLIRNAKHCALSGLV